MYVFLKSFHNRDAKNFASFNCIHQNRAWTECSASVFSTMKYIRSKSLKRLFSFGRSSLEDEEHSNYNHVIVEESQKSARPSWRCFSYDEICTATNSFSPENLVGRGGYAEVYKGVVTVRDDGEEEEIAVKRVAMSCRDERKEKEFLSEIGTICHVSHPNVLSLLGCCIDNGLFLIFNFSSIGSVSSLLHDENRAAMDWRTRYKIAIGTAKGIQYLHTGCQRRIIHRDIKSSNILLTPDFEPLISDFGLAKWLPSQWTHHSIAPIEGTFGWCQSPSLVELTFCGIVHRMHLAPEYYLHGIVDEKTDVFAFGVFLLEIISGRKAVDESHQSIHSWAQPILEEEEMEKVVDPRLGGAYDVGQLRRLAFAASLCIRASSTWRLTITQALEVMVEGEMDQEKWKMPKEEKQEELLLWGLDLEDFECKYWDTYSSISLEDSISTTSSSAALL